MTFDFCAKNGVKIHKRLIFNKELTNHDNLKDITQFGATDYYE
jgi:hypothetical protein